MQAAPRSRGFALAVATLAVFTDSLVYSLIIPILPALVAEPSVAREQEILGLLVGVYGLAIVVATPASGVLIDKVGNRAPMMIGMFALGASTLLLGLTTSVPGLVAVRALQGISCAATATASLAMLASTFPAQERGKAMGIWTSGNACGTLAGPPLGGLLFQTFGLWGPLVLGAGLAVLDGLARASLPGSRAALAPPLRALTRHPALFDVCAIAGLGAAGLTLLEATLPLHVQSRFGASPVLTGAFFVVATIAFGVTSPIVGALEQRLGRLRAAILGLLALACLQPLFALAPSLPWAFVAVALVGAAVGVTITPAMPALAELVDRLGATSYGVAYSLFNTAFAVGMAAGPILGTALIARLGLPLGLGTMSAVIAACALVLLRRHRGRS